MGSLGGAATSEGESDMPSEVIRLKAELERSEETEPRPPHVVILTLRRIGGKTARG